MRRRLVSALPVLALACVTASPPSTSSPPSVRAQTAAPARPKPAETPQEILQRAERLAEAYDLRAVSALHGEHRARLHDPEAAELDLLLAGVHADLAHGGSEGASLERALELAAGVRARVPDHVRAHTRPARWLLRARKVAEARALAEQAIAIAPTDRQARRVLWDAILATPGATQAELRLELVPLLEAVVASPADEWALYDAAKAFGRLGLDARREQLWQRLETEHADSEATDYVAWDRIDALQERAKLQRHQQGKSSPLIAAELERRYRAIVAAPAHRPEYWRGRAWLNLFFLVHSREDAIDPDDFLAIVEGVVEHQKLANFHLVYTLVPSALAERTPHHARALEIVEQGFASLDAAVAASPRPDKPATRRDFLVLLRIAKAAILVKVGRLDEAEAVLQEAEADAGKRPDVLAGQGAIDEARGDPEAARAHYLEGVGLEVSELNRPCSEALHRVYVAERRTERGFDRYLRRVQAERQAARKAALLAELAHTDGELAPFRLASLRGKTVASEDLEGKIAVVHCWATWCGFCVVEMKALAELAKKYERDPSVAIVLVSGDTEVAALRAWMDEHGLGVDTLIEAGYAADTGIRSWPTTLFLDEHGKIRARVLGATSNLVEEFSWRIDALKAGRAQR